MILVHGYKQDKYYENDKQTNKGVSTCLVPKIRLLQCMVVLDLSNYVKINQMLT